MSAATVNRMSEVYSLLPSLKGTEFTLADIKRMIGVPNLSPNTLARLYKQGYLEKVRADPGKAPVFTVRGL